MKTASPPAWVEARVQRVHEEREERVDEVAVLRPRPSGSPAVDGVLDVGVEGVAETVDVPGVRSAGRAESSAPGRQIASDACARGGCPMSRRCRSAGPASRRLPHHHPVGAAHARRHVGLE